MVQQKKRMCTYWLMTFTPSALLLTENRVLMHHASSAASLVPIYSKENKNKNKHDEKLATKLQPNEAITYLSEAQVIIVIF